MSTNIKIILMSVFLLLGSSKISALDTTQFSDAKQQARYTALTKELRCLVCQNESIAGSSSELAQDLRAQVAEQIRTGKSDTEIRAYMTQRYGDFILYRPPNEGKTKLLWMAPILFLLLFLLVFVGIVSSKNKTSIENVEELE